MRHECTSLEVVKDKCRPRFGAEKSGQRKDTVEIGGHDITTSRENGGAGRSWSGIAEMDNIRAGDKSTGGARIKANMRGGWAIYGRER